MIHRELIHVAVADSAVILRSGLISVLKMLPDVNIETIEVTSMKSLENCMLSHRPDVIVVNPTFEGWFNIEEFKKTWPSNNIKFIALLSNITDANFLKDYDESFNILDDIDIINKKFVDLMHFADDEAESEQEALSIREKEIICCVVKGMTNKEIAENLFLSVHTVMTHRRNIAKKLQIHSPAGLTIYAIVNKLVDISDVKISG